MPDTALLPRSVLHDRLRPGRQGAATGPAGVVIREKTGLTLAAVAALRGRDGAVIAALTALFGVSPPTRLRLVRDEGLAVIGTGPGQWLIAVDPMPDGSRDLRHGDLTTTLRDRLGGLAAVTDQSDAWVVFDLAGARVRDLLARCVAIDLDPRRFEPGDVALTRAGPLDVRLWHGPKPGRYTLSCFRSYGAYLARWLTDSALPFGLELVETR
ncbi:MAG: sarcosine oxidase subunit gamma family protein [Azospirillaceae bacterium]|nr:sarcosine oxidase subunit gamma family protein [Azospirillaceae bacterium]